MINYKNYLSGWSWLPSWGGGGARTGGARPGCLTRTHNSSFSMVSSPMRCMSVSSSALRGSLFLALRASSMPAKASSRHCSRPVELDSQLPGNRIQELAPEEAEHHLTFSGRSPALSLSQRPHPNLPRGDSGRPTASFRLPWRPSPHHLVIIPPFCHLPVLLGHVLSPNPVSKKTGSTSILQQSQFPPNCLLHQPR